MSEFVANSYRDQQILALWRVGKHADEIARIVDLLHELNRLLREQAERRNP